MSEPHPNLLTYLAAIDAFNRNDVAAVAAYVRPDFVYRIPGRSHVAGEFRGVDGFIDVLTRLREASAGTIQLDPVVVLDAENLIARARVTAQRGTQRLNTENCYAFRFLDGKVADGQVFLSEPDRVEDFWAAAEPASDSSTHG